jgi:hypothetical protein
MYELMGYDITFVYILLAYVFYLEVIKLFDLFTKDWIEDKFKLLGQLKKEMYPIMNTGSVELFTLQRTMYATLFQLYSIIMIRFACMILPIVIIIIVLPTVTCPLPIVLDLDFTFKSVVNPAIAFINVFVWVGIIKLILNIIKFISYTNQLKNIKYNELAEDNYGDEINENKR